MLIDISIVPVKKQLTLVRVTLHQDSGPIVSEASETTDLDVDELIERATEQAAKIAEKTGLQVTMSLGWKPYRNKDLVLPSEVGEILEDVIGA